MESLCSGNSDGDASETTRTVFVCGFVAKRWHNSSLQAIIQDLLPEYYVASNGESWNENSATRSLLTNAEAMLFFVNEFTLGDKNCLMILQYAWHIMVPLIMLRPPRTKLVICKREQTHNNIIVAENGSIIKGTQNRWSPIDDSHTESVDYNLMQDILHEGYKLSIVYDRLDHPGSMTKIIERLQQVMSSSLRRGSRQTPAFYLSPTNGPELIERAFYDGEITTERAEKYCTELMERQNRVTRSLGNLKDNADTNFSRKPFSPTSRGFTNKYFEIPPLDANKDNEGNTANSHQLATNSTNHPPSTASRTSSRDGRMSSGTLDDLSNFQETQYLVFPIQSTSGKPKLIKFPEDLMEENGQHDGSVWGSETSLEDNSEVAMTINGGISIDDNEEGSPIGSPAPYIGDL
ncbi:unnamed protein product [Haemonchus placei]|uniref:TIR domain-containing protein n=1 Tax=Haemonchus placei TaxID=6290 RepID=A0A158QNW0_HAEPC|nr:unnamed protein product [Haemonchus placei]